MIILTKFRPESEIRAKIYQLHVKSKIWAQKIDESAIRCNCRIRISFILLLIKWSEMDPNVKPQTVVVTFDQANYNSIPEYNVAPITLLAYPAVSTCPAERRFSGIKRLQTPLLRTMTDEAN